MRALARLVNIIIEIIEAIIGIHIILKLFDANSSVPFVRWMFHLSQPLLRPFHGIFKDMVFSGHYVLDLSAVFALIIYGIVGYLIMLLFGSLGKRGRRRKRR
jgi:uncharacterized protein YggT (Ycf19 family)